MKYRNWRSRGSGKVHTEDLLLENVVDLLNHDAGQERERDQLETDMTETGTEEVAQGTETEIEREHDLVHLGEMNAQGKPSSHMFI